MHLWAPAKINLFLEVDEKRNDGYHNIDSVFSAIALFDEIRLDITDTGKISVTSDHPSVPDGEDNIVYKAAQMIKKRLNKDVGFDVSIKKSIPVGAGLGGGSSNAASVLKALIRHFCLDTEEIKDESVQLGADVPFFLNESGMAHCTGIGDRIDFIQPCSPLYIVIVNPGIFVNTGSIYHEISIDYDKEKPDKIIDSIQNDDIQNISNHLFNRMERVVVKRYPVIEQIKTELKTLGCIGALMSGSGSTVFALATSESQGYGIVREMRRQHGDWFIDLVQSLPTMNEVPV